MRAFTSTFVLFTLGFIHFRIEFCGSFRHVHPFSHLHQLSSFSAIETSRGGISFPSTIPYFSRTKRLNLHPGGGFGNAPPAKNRKRNKKNNVANKSKRESENIFTKPNSASAPTSTLDSVVYRKDYREPEYWISQANLLFDIVNDEKVIVTSTLTVQPNSKSLQVGDLVFDGDANAFQLKQVSILKNDGNTILDQGTQYEKTQDTLRIKREILEGQSTVQIQTIVEHSFSNKKNAPLSGLYQRDGMFFTHCEPTGFRQITYFIDRPDNTAIFKVRIEAPKTSYPLLLSNGNRVASGEVDQNRHFVEYLDPYPKPSYIFGLVAADDSFACLEDNYTTSSGRVVALRIYSEAKTLSRMRFAMDTLKKSMAWDEDTYGLEYDLEEYNIVAANHFVLGAMENKGLNLFQTSLIATDPSCTTDVTYDLVEKTVAHEYFHNWSGNRVTVRDWFEFSLKEGLTVYRDQEFTADVGLRVATRIEAVKILREKQFREDASDFRHPVRPESARASREHALDALASSTTYHKGAEVSFQLTVL